MIKNKMAIKIKYLILVLLLFFPVVIFGQIPITIMSYNTSDNGNVWTATTPIRIANMRNVISSINPDIFVAIEINNNNTDAFLNYVLNYDSTTYSKGAFIPNNDTISHNSNCLYYKTAKFNGGSFSNVVIPSYLDLNSTPSEQYRDINKFTITQNGGSTIIIYAVHLISSGHIGFTGQADTARANEISYLLSYIANNAASTDNYVVLGDFNTDSADEHAYKNLLYYPSGGLKGYFYDPNNYPPTVFGSWSQGYWSSSKSYRSTGLFARYDMILMSQNIWQDNNNKNNNIKYNVGSYTVLGNPSPSTDEQAASDHLPVYATFNFTDLVAPVELVSFTGRIKGDKVELNWETATEVNNYGFGIQRSLDNISWKGIGFVPGNGNSDAPKYYSFIDKSVPDVTIYYRLKQQDSDGKISFSSVVKLYYDIPSMVSLSQNYPNPFNPVSTIEYSLPTAGFVSLKVYDILGREITTLVNEKQGQGKHLVNFNGNKLSSGVYFYVLTANDIVLSKKMNLLK
jgi:endonuclease/exonuclease/phosphatase family metal-dependent hydrolase